jgi:hypothetical protein
MPTFAGNHSHMGLLACPRRTPFGDSARHNFVLYLLALLVAPIEMFRQPPGLVWSFVSNGSTTALAASILPRR